MLKKFRVLGLIFLGAVTTSLTHGIDFYSSPGLDESAWTLQGFPIPFHHEDLYHPDLVLHNWPGFFIDMVFWALAWALVFYLVAKFYRKALKKK